MSKSSLWFVGVLACVGGCAGTEPGEAVSETSPLAVIQVSEGRRIEFHASGNDVMVAQRYRVGESPLLSEADKKLSPPDLYRKYAPAGSAIPGALYGKQDVTDGDLVEAPSAARSAWGGGQEAPRLVDGDVSGTSAALNLGDGCNPPQSNVVFADCRRNWFGGYFAEGVATWFLDERVQALRGSLDTVVTSKYGGGTFVNTYHVAQGEVLNQHWPKARVCKTFLGVTISCSDTKAQRRIDIVNASSTTFNVDDVFFN